MYTTENYSMEFWNSMKSKHPNDSILNEGKNNVNGAFFLPSQSSEKYKAALEKDCSWETVVRLFESKEFTEDDALVQARCAFILHDGYYDFDSGKVNLWLPK